MQKGNKGYSFVELIIVIAIMAILAAASLITVGIVNNARASAVATELDSQIGALLNTTKAQSPTEALYIQVMSNANNFGKSSYSYSTGSMVVTSNTASDFSMNTSIKPYDTTSWFNNKVVIEYVPENTNQQITEYSSDPSKIIIQFNKSDGSVRKGAGRYIIHKRVNNSMSDYSGDVVATVYLNASTGNHYIKQIRG